MRAPQHEDLGPGIIGHRGDQAVGQGLPATTRVARGLAVFNSSLTVEDGQPASHSRRGWEALTDSLIAVVADEVKPKVFMLWGAHAQAKAPLIASSGRAHLVLQSNHPSPLSATRGPLPFIGCGHFNLANQFLARHGATPLDWSLE